MKFSPDTRPPSYIFSGVPAYGISDKEAAVIAGQVAAAFAAHFRGDAHFTGPEMIGTRGLSLMAGIIVGLRRDLVAGLWHHTEPPDNDLVIDLARPYVLARASSSSASCALGTVSSGFTLYQARWITPFSSMRNDDRMMPL